jgi:hypothetical protein
MAQGGWLESKSQKLSRWGSVLADKIQGASILGRWDLGGAGEAKLRVGGGGSLAGMQSGIWFYLPVSFPIPSLFPNPLFPPTLSNHPFPPLKILWWVVYGWDVVVGGGGRDKFGGSVPQVM